MRKRERFLRALAVSELELPFSSWWFSGFLFISDKVANFLFARNFAPLIKAIYICDSLGKTVIKLDH